MKHVAVMPPHTEERVETGIGFRVMRIVFRCSLILTVGVVLLLGLWAIAALVAGTVSAGGVLELVKGWLAAAGGS